MNIFGLLLATSSTEDIIIVVSILLVGLIVAVGIVLGLKQSEKRMLKKKKASNEKKSLNLKIVDEFISKKEVNFLASLKKALPDELVAFPKVSLTSILQPTGDKVGYNLLTNQVVDVCIFTRENMKPILIIDLIEAESVVLSMNKMNSVSKNAVQSVKLPILEIDLKNGIDEVNLRKQIIQALPDKIVTIIKQNLLDEISKRGK